MINFLDLEEKWGFFWPSRHWVKTKYQLTSVQELGESAKAVWLPKSRFHYAFQ